jgi:hypothetical protein
MVNTVMVSALGLETYSHLPEGWQTIPAVLTSPVVEPAGKVAED